MSTDPIIYDIVAQHAQEISFLWRQRCLFLRSRHLGLDHLLSYDERFAAHMDGLRVAGDAGRTAVAPAGDDEPGALFAATLLALEARNVQQIDALLSLAEALHPLQTALFSAFGWVSARFLHGTAKALLAATSSFRRRLGIACCVMHGVDPGQPLNVAVNSRDPILRARGLSAIGELGRTDLRALCDRYLSDPDPLCRFDAARSTVFLGNRDTALEALTSIVLESATTRARGFSLMLQAMSVSESHRVLQRLRKDPHELRLLIHGSGIVGDPAYVPWLIGLMDNAQTARVAGEAFSLITGADTGHDGLEGARPENFESGPNDDPSDSNVELDPDDGLPWPDPQKIESWWVANGSRFQCGARYFMGAAVTRERCIDVLKNGYQRQRIVAAHYLCLLEPGTPLFNTSAPAWRQRRLLAKLS
jgi:uncharacterized protein (TIGR02270 family)